MKDKISLDYDYLRDELFRGSLPAFQKNALIAIVTEFGRRLKEKDSVHKSQLAYILATAYHESQRFKHDREIGYGASRDYGRKMLLIRGSSVAYYGRGWVQLTWLRNYAILSLKATQALGREIDLVNNPDLVFEDTAINSFVLVEGMMSGLFTGKRLDKYVSEFKTDYKEARRVVNGTDKADQIAEYAKVFLQSIK